MGRQRGHGWGCSPRTRPSVDGQGRRLLDKAVRAIPDSSFQDIGVRVVWMSVFMYGVSRSLSTAIS